MQPRGVRYQAAIIEGHHVLLIRIFLREDGRSWPRQRPPAHRSTSSGQPWATAEPGPG